MKSTRRAKKPFFPCFLSNTPNYQATFHLPIIFNICYSNTSTLPLRSCHSCAWSIVKTSGTQFQNYLIMKESVSLLSLLAFRGKNKWESQQPSAETAASGGGSAGSRTWASQTPDGQQLLVHTMCKSLEYHRKSKPKPDTLATLQEITFPVASCTTFCSKQPVKYSLLAIY